MTLFDGNWRPPKEGPYRRCDRTDTVITSVGYIRKQCHKEAVWWAPRLPACYCEKHVPNLTKKIIKHVWLSRHYRTVLTALRQKGCHVD